MILARLRARMAALAALAAFSGGAAPAPAAATGSDPAFGFWLVESGEAIIRIDACGGSACARIVWLKSPLDERGEPRRDRRNPDEGLRGRTMCGLEIMSGFRREGPGEWADGEIYNGRDGKTYSAQFARQEDGTLEVRGYVGVPLLGQSQVWTREEGDRGGCAIG